MNRTVRKRGREINLTFVRSPKIGGHLDIGKSGIRNPESGFCFFSGICLYWISLVFYSFLSLVQGIFHVELFFYYSRGLNS